MAENQLVIALDVGGSSIKSGVADLTSLDVTGFDITPIDSHGTANEIIETLCGVIEHHHNNIPQCGSIGIGFPGPCNYEAGISYIDGVDKYEAIYGLNVHDAIQAKLSFDAPIRFRNDAEAAIVGEAVYGVGKGYSRVIGLTLGTGSGSAFLRDGIAQTSGQGVPENGWIYPLLFDGEPADDVFSTRGLLKRLHTASLDVQTVAEAVSQADENAIVQSVLAKFGSDLGQFMQSLVHNFLADVLILQGGIAQGFDYFGDDVKAQLTIPVLVGELERDAALLGAANLFKD